MPATSSVAAGIRLSTSYAMRALADGLTSGLKDASDAAAKRAEMGSEYEAEYIESEMTLREELLMQLRSESLQMARMMGLIAPRSELDRALDPVLEQARSIARLNDPRGLYAYCWCREPRGSVKEFGLPLMLAFNRMLGKCDSPPCVRHALPLTLTPLAGTTSPAL
jgi:hypothetical protein